MFLSIDRESSVPVYIQVRKRIVEMIKDGTLAPGDRLPGTRDLARQLGVSRKTILQAYLELAADNWVESRPGSCTYVLDRAALIGVPRLAPPPLEVVQPVGDGGEAMDWSPLVLEGQFFSMPPHRQHWHGKDEWISFSRAIPDVRLFPFERIKKVSSQMMWDPKAYFFDYGHPQGYQPLIEYLEARLAKDGVRIAQGGSDVVIASGFQSALNLLITMLVEPGDLVAVEDPTFNSILNLLSARNIHHTGIPMERDGMDVDYLERQLAKEKPKLVITIPTLHNPTGTTMSREKRERVIQLAQRYGVPIVEDNWSMLLEHEGRSEPSLKTMDAGGHVIQIGSFSKSFLPGTRVAWLVLPEGISTSFVRAKRAMDRSDSYFLQTLVHEFIKKGFMDLHCRKVDRIYRGRRELTDELMHQHFPPEVSWKRPQGGFTYWVSLPARLSSMRLLELSIAQGVEFAPGSFFYVDRRDSSNFRLAFSTLTQPQLRIGIRRLGRVLQQAIREELDKHYSGASARGVK